MEIKNKALSKKNFDKYDYNERIKLFNKYIIKRKIFEDISYFVVDEIQDLVNERAESGIKKYLAI